jgi:hypothetical protein
MNELDLAYAAGIIDGEGCISVKNKKVVKKDKAISSPCIYLCMADKELIYWFKDYFGTGYLEHRKGRQAHYKDQYRWVIEGNKCLEFLSLISPYLRGKKPQALELLKWPTHKHSVGGKLAPESLIERARITNRLKELKRLV